MSRLDGEVLGFAMGTFLVIFYPAFALLYNLVVVKVWKHAP